MKCYTVTLSIPVQISMEIMADSEDEACIRAERFAAMNGIEKYHMEWDEDRGVYAYANDEEA